jgi:hypothetical protein
MRAAFAFALCSAVGDASSRWKETTNLKLDNSDVFSPALIEKQQREHQVELAALKARTVERAREAAEWKAEHATGTPTGIPTGFPTAHPTSSPAFNSAYEKCVSPVFFSARSKHDGCNLLLGS